MSDLNTEDLDVNSDRGFLAAVARAAEVEIPEGQLDRASETDRSISTGLETVEEGSAREDRSRDEQGRFAPVAPPEDTEAEGAAPEEEVEEEAGDDVATRLAAIERERDEAQSLIGRQGNELGQSRQENQELRERLARIEGMLQSRSEAPAQLPVADDSTIEGLENLYASNGARNMMDWVINNRPDLIEAAEEVWAADDPLEASGFRARRVAIETAQRFGQPAPQPQATAPDPRLQQVLQREESRNLYETIRAASGEDWSAVKDHLVETMKELPSFVQKEITNPSSAETREEAITHLLSSAKVRAIRTATDTAQAREREAALERKKGARVASGSLRQVPERKPEDVGSMSKEERTKAFHDLLLSTPSTSVADGLTYSGR